MKVQRPAPLDPYTDQHNGVTLQQLLRATRNRKVVAKTAYPTHDGKEIYLDIEKKSLFRLPYATFDISLATEGMCLLKAINLPRTRQEAP